MHIFYFLFTVLLSINLNAQHCPYDGTHLLAIKVVNKHGKMFTPVNTVFYLLEVDNPMADSCTTAAGLVKKRFLSRDAFITEMDRRFNRNGYNKELNNRLKDAGIFTNANMMLTLNQAENTCTLIGKSETVYSNYIYQQRKFVLVYTVNDKEFRLPVPTDFICSLCKSSSDIYAFKPLLIKL